MPAIEGSWRYDAAAKSIVVSVRQTQTADPYEFPLELGIAGASGPSRVVSLQVAGRDASMTIPVDAEPASVTLDPNVSLLAEFGAFGPVRK